MNFRNSVLLDILDVLCKLPELKENLLFYSCHDWPDPDQEEEGDREGLGFEPEV